VHVRHHGRRSPCLRILIVDDNRDAAESLSILLRRRRHEVRVASNAGRGLEAAAEWKPDAVLLDIGLPDLDGFELARRLRARPDGGRLALIAVSGRAPEEQRARSEQAGLDAALMKPVDLDLLEQELEAASGRRAASR
jgi:CheY-like chemotaxis protein